MGFLTERELIVRYRGKQSDRKWLPGGSPQGTRLGLFLFLILINAAGYEEHEKHLGEHITLKQNKRKIIPSIHMKFVDNMKECVIKNPDPNLSFNELIPPRGHRGGCHSRKWGSSIEAGPSPSWVRAHGDLTNQKQVFGVLTNQRLVFTRPGHVFKTRVSVIEHVPALDTGVQMDRSPDVVDHLDLDEDDIEHHEIQDKR